MEGRPEGSFACLLVQEAAKQRQDPLKDCPVPSSCFGSGRSAIQKKQQRQQKISVAGRP